MLRNIVLVKLIVMLIAIGKIQLLKVLFSMLVLQMVMELKLYMPLLEVMI